jgi:hypothetical protein
LRGNLLNGLFRIPISTAKKIRIETKGYLHDRQGTMMKRDLSSIRIKAHRANIDRYRKLLARRLTQVEREYVMRRIAEERAEIKHLEDAADVAAASAPSFPNLLAEREIRAAVLPWEQRL